MQISEHSQFQNHKLVFANYPATHHQRTHLRWQRKFKFLRAAPKLITEHADFYNAGLFVFPVKAYAPAAESIVPYGVYVTLGMDDGINRQAFRMRRQ